MKVGVEAPSVTKVLFHFKLSPAGTLKVAAADIILERECLILDRYT